MARTPFVSTGLWLAGAGVAFAQGPVSGDAFPGTDVIDAVRRQDPTAVRGLLERPVDVDARSGDGATALQWAVYLDDAAMTRRLLAAGADPNAANELGVTPLALACGNGSGAAVEALLAAGADPNATRWSGETVLMTCAGTGSAGAVEALLSAGADPNRAEPSERQTALMWAVSARRPAATRALIEGGARVSARTRRGFTPLLFAAREGDLDSARLLLDAGAHVQEPAADGTSALVVATVRGHTALILWLLEQGADPNAAGSGYTALHWAAGTWETELTGPAGIEVARDEEWRALTGVPAGRRRLVQALVAHGADVDARLVRAPRRIGFTAVRPDVDDATPFYLAAMAGDVEMMRLLVGYGADTRLATRRGTTALMAAAGLGRRLVESSVTQTQALAATRLAWELGGDVRAVNEDGDTALHGAARIGAPPLVRFLVARGADPSTPNARGQTPLDRTTDDATAAILRALTSTPDAAGPVLPR